MDGVLADFCWAQKCCCWSEYLETPGPSLFLFIRNRPTSQFQTSGFRCFLHRATFDAFALGATFAGAPQLATAC